MTNIHGIQLFDGLSQGLENVLDLRRARHALGASNIANADTPGYLAKELPFDSLLLEVMGAPLAGEAVSVEDRAVETMWEREAPEASLDGNSVVVEEQMLKMAESRMAYDAAIGFYQKSMSMIRMAARKPGAA